MSNFLGVQGKLSAGIIKGNCYNGLKSIDIYSPREVTNYEE